MRTDVLRSSLWSLQGLRKLLVLSKCDRDGDLGYVLIFQDCGEVRSISPYLIHFLVVLRTSCCWMTEITVLSQAQTHGGGWRGDIGWFKHCGHSLTISRVT